MPRELLGRSPCARDNGSEWDLGVVDLGETIDPGWLAACWPELMVQIPCDLATLLQLL